MLYHIDNNLVTISSAKYLQPVPICTRGFETKYMQIQCNRERERKIYLQNAGNQKGFRPSKLEPITDNIVIHMLQEKTQNIQKRTMQNTYK